LNYDFPSPSFPLLLTSRVFFVALAAAETLPIHRKRSCPSPIPSSSCSKHALKPNSLVRVGEFGVMCLGRCVEVLKICTRVPPPLLSPGTGVKFLLLIVSAGFFVDLEA